MNDTGEKQVKWQEIKSMADSRNTDPREIEISLLKEGSIPLHYVRNIKAISKEEQLQLLQTRVGVCGCGGLGLNIINHLARMGVGHITVWDPDIFSESNLNRQLWSNFPNLGESKVDVCLEEIAKINPAVTVTSIQSRWEDSAGDLFRQQNVIVDALDSIPARLDLADACAAAGVPLVHGAVGGWYGQLTVIMPGDRCLHDWYGKFVQQGIENVLGTLPFTAAVIASMQAAEAIKLLIGRESVLKDEFCLVDLLDLSLERIKKCNNDVT